MPGMPSTKSGICGLCGTPESLLCYSDLMPKAIYRWFRLMSNEPNPLITDGSNPNPILITKKRTTQKNYQIAEYFLCPKCEDRLNKGGETWVLKNTYRGGEHFPMRSNLKQAQLLNRSNGVHLLDVSVLPEFQLSKLIHFACGIFWKAAARKWNSVDNYSTQLKLGPYEESFRRYLMNDAPFPAGAALIVNISGNLKPLMCSIYPYYEGRTSDTRQYRMALPGVAFWLHLGHLTDEMKALCAVRNNVVCLVQNLNAIFLRDGGKLISLSPPLKLR